MSFCRHLGKRGVDRSDADSDVPSPQLRRQQHGHGRCTGVIDDPLRLIADRPCEGQHGGHTGEGGKQSGYIIAV